MAMLRRAATGTGFQAVRRGLRCFGAEARAAVDTAQDVGFYPNPEGPSRGDAVNNFKLAAVGVVPQRGSAVHGGLNRRRLAKIAGANKSGVVASGAKPGKDCRRVVAGESISWEEADAIVAGVQQHLSSSATLFVEDALVGSARGTGIPVRAVSEDAASALSLRNILEQESSSAEAVHRSISVFLAPTAPVDGPTVLVAAEDDGTANVVVAGAASAGEVCDAVGSAAASISHQKSADAPHYLPCDAMVSGADGGAKVALLFGGSAGDRAAAAAAGTLYSGHGSVVTSDGVARLLGGSHVVGSKLKGQAGDVNVGDGLVVSRVSANIVGAPTSVIFAGSSLTKDASVAELLAEAVPGVPEERAAAFEEIISASGASVDVVAAGGAAAAVDKALK